MGLLPLLLSITLGPTSAVPLAAAKADALPALASTLPASPDVARAAAGPDVSGKYFGARYYGSRIGRFTTVDPALDQEALLNPQKWNRYAYSRNNPLRYVDPDGRDDRGVMEIEQRQALARLGPGPTQLTPEQQRVEAIFRGWVFEPLLLLSYLLRSPGDKMGDTGFEPVTPCV